MRYKIGVIGTGNISGGHLKAIEKLEQLELVGVADIVRERAEQAAEQYGVKAYANYQEMVLEQKPDIVVNTLPPFLHREVSIWCAEQGCHMMLEKPMAPSLEDCNAIIDAYRRLKLKLMVGHTIHYIRDNIVAKSIIESKQLGELITINDMRHMKYYQPNRPQWCYWKAQAGGGVFTNLGTHSIDRIQWMTGSPIVKVKASFTYGFPVGDVESSGLAYVETASGVTATISQSGYGGVNRNEAEFLFTDGMLRLATGSGLWISRDGKYEPVELPELGDTFVLQYRDLLDALDRDADPSVSGEYARSVVQVVNTMYESHRVGRELAVQQL
ncbi:Gfo/Idh/MocA family protein [Paenibacillus koleovorans]|uniref:Gfo/Idh/MocA family protein n=1 Tax=Paenibacillus koleovorans TaxID=121608 RepID=UPI000FD74FBE|nr:Gfo/Idh/MocA family oxidoreductase [Paenibacillus koleovorans]